MAPYHRAMLRRTAREIGVLIAVVGLGACGTTPASEGHAPGSPPPERPALSPTAPTGDFPLPAAARLFSETQSSVSYLTSPPARAVLAFYDEQLRGRYPFTSIPNGLALQGDAAPFVYVTVAVYGDDVLLTLTRNALVDTHAARVPARVFGAPLPPGATLFTRTPEIFVAHARQTVAEVCAWYDRELFAKDSRGVRTGPESEATREFAAGVSKVGDTTDGAASPYCMFTHEGAQPRGEWTVVSVIPDRASGTTLVSVIGSP